MARVELDRMHASGLTMSARLLGIAAVYRDSSTVLVI